MFTIKKHIPNFVTSLNVTCGVLGITQAFAGNLQTAFIFMLGAALADYLDGFTARMLSVVSPMGKELDSLCDMVSFGVLPGMMLFKLMAACGGPDGILGYAPLLIPIFSALRLAKFNIDPRQGENFIGLATPACAMICASVCQIVITSPGSGIETLCSTAWFIPVLSAVLSLLLVCELPMFSMKIKKGAAKSITAERAVFFAAAAVAIVITAILRLNWAAAVLMIFSAYILENLAAWPFQNKNK
ncbi:MAG: CDP-diacylglycerol--serine O-phosphatidyltransferase [Bacteroidales bacterium]|nr:CDP-diacylglycerol--serine O-phosphatidyltransferase [Bacteroidales bacterium]